jgi:hypothetical protein
VHCIACHSSNQNHAMSTDDGFTLCRRRERKAVEERAREAARKAAWERDAPRRRLRELEDELEDLMDTHGTSACCTWCAGGDVARHEAAVRSNTLEFERITREKVKLHAKLRG